MNKLIIDRFEGTYAVCESEDKTPKLIPKYKLPPACKEGDTLFLDSNGMFQIDSTSTSIREKRIRDKMNRLLK